LGSTSKHDSEHIIIIATDPVYWKYIAEIVEIAGVEHYFVNKFHDYDIYGKKEVGKINKYKKLINAVSEILEDNEDKIKWKIITDSMVKSNVSNSLEYLNKDETKNNTMHEYYLEFGAKLQEGDVVIEEDLMMVHRLGFFQK
jgi:hypothetical protein